MYACWRTARNSSIPLLLAFGLFAADEGFAKWWPRFQSAVKSGDGKAVAVDAKFPMQWENGPVREIATQAEFVRRFDSYFAADMKHAVATAKPVQIPDGYMITWKARGNEYSLYFKPSGAGFALNGLSEGPP
jgi:hypothetical protein